MKDIDIIESYPRDFYLSLNNQYGVVKTFIDDYGNLWSLFIVGEEINIIQFIPSGDL